MEKLFCYSDVDLEDHLYSLESSLAEQRFARPETPHTPFLVPFVRDIFRDKNLFTQTPSILRREE